MCLNCKELFFRVYAFWAPRPKNRPGAATKPEIPQGLNAPNRNWGLSSLSPKSTSERQPMYQLALWGSPRVLKGQRGRRADSFPVLGHWPFEFIQVRVVGITQASNHRGETNRPGTTGESGAMRRALSHENVPTHRQQNPSQGQPEVGKRGNTSRGRGGRGGDGTGGELPQLRRRGATAV